MGIILACAVGMRIVLNRVGENENHNHFQEGAENENHYHSHGESENENHYQIVQMYQKVRILAQKRYIPHSLQSKIFSLNTVFSQVPIPFPRKSLYHAHCLIKTAAIFLGGDECPVDVRVAHGLRLVLQAG
jgi:hypothetical protein